MKRYFLILTILFIQVCVFAQNSPIRINGIVIDAETGSPVSGASITEQGTGNGVTSDLNGSFTIQASPNSTLEVSSIGYVRTTVPVEGRTDLRILLELVSSELDEVVVVGYGTQKKSDLTGAVASFNAEVLEQMPQVDITQALQGRVAGLNVSFSGSNAEGGSSNLLIRGKNSISANNEPFIVLDGMPYAGNLSEINPTDIESVTILKDASSAAIYGARAANGVMLITTKRGTQGTMKVSLNSYYGVSDITNMPDMQDAETFFETKLLRFGRDNISITEREGYLEAGTWIG